MIITIVSVYFEHSLISALSESTPSTSFAAVGTQGSEGVAPRKVANPDSAKKRLFKLDDDEPKASTSADDQKPSTSSGNSSEAEADKKDPPKGS